MKLDKIATDFEKFVHDGSTISSSIGLIGGSKDAPVWVKNGNLQEDNVLAEAATHPCDSFEMFLSTIHGLNSELLQALPAGYSLVTKATNRYTQDFLMSCGSNALRFGCSSEVQAWTGETIPAPSPFTELRSAGAHIHFSYDNPTLEKTLAIIQMMDYLLGAWSVLMDTDRERRELYGKAGSCRIKDYGGEYRALSNFWIDDANLIEQVYKRTQLALEFAANPALLYSIAPSEVLRAAIDSYDVTVCQRIEDSIRALPYCKAL